MTPEQIDRVFGRGRLKMVTGAHVEVFREAAAPGESRRYTKRFLTTPEGDYEQWTEREWRILARLIGHGTRSVPDVVQYDRGAHGTKLVQTYDAGATVDQWATLLPVEREGRVHAHVFEDCAHWWALAHHCLVALEEIHSLQLVHLDVKGDNICIPVGPPNFDPAAGGRMFPVFRKLALIDFAFSLVSGESLTTALPIGWQQEYDYQSPRLLHALEAGRAGNLEPTEDLDWRCDMYSLAAMLKRYLPDEARLYDSAGACGWTPLRFDAAKALILRLREVHDREATARWPHAELVESTSAELHVGLVESLERGWKLAYDAPAIELPALPLTPITRLARPMRLVIPPGDEIVTARITARVHEAPKPRSRRIAASLAAIASVAALAAAASFHPASGPMLTQAAARLVDGGRALSASLRDRFAPGANRESTADAAPTDPPPAPSPATTATAEPPARTDSPGPTTPRETAPDTTAASDQAPPAPAASRSQSVRGHESLAAQIEAHRPKTVTTATRVARASSDAARTSRQAAEARRRPAAIAGKRAPASMASRTPQAVASKRTRPSPAIASSVPRVPPVVVASLAGWGAAAAQSPVPAVAPAPAPSVAAALPSPATVEPAVATAPAPPIEPTKPVAPPASVTVKPGMAPIVEHSRPRVPTLIAAPRPAAPAPVETPRSTPSAVDADDDDDVADNATRLVAEVIPRSSARVYARIIRALLLAASTRELMHERMIADAALSASSHGDAVVIAVGTSPGEARRWHDQARRAYRSRRSLEAFELAQKAFGANPNDAEIAGHFAWLHLKVVPVQAERARQLALHAIGLKNAHSAVADDWTTFAIASALSGRPIDARNAFYVALAITRDADRTCRAALGSLANHGERLREPVEALLHRLHAQGRFDESASCAWPVGRLAGGRVS